MSVEKRYQRTMAHAAVSFFIGALFFLVTTSAVMTRAQPPQASIKWLALVSIIVTSGLLILKLLYLYIASAALAKKYNEPAGFSLKGALRVYGKKALRLLALMFAVSFLLQVCLEGAQISVLLLLFPWFIISALTSKRVNVRTLEKRMKRLHRPELLASLNNNKHNVIVKGILSFPSTNDSDSACALSFRAAGSATAMMLLGQAPAEYENPRIFIAFREDLLSTLTEEELRAVCLHEMGHWHSDHAGKAALDALLGWFLVAVGLAGAYLLGTIYSVEFLPLTVAGGLCGWAATSLQSKYFSRLFEYQADAFAVENGSAEHLVGALKKCSAGSWHTDDDCQYWLYEALFETHPSVPDRIAQVERLS